MGDKKLKLLYLAKYLEEETDQEHPAGMPELLAYLTANGISAERKSGAETTPPGSVPSASTDTGPRRRCRTSPAAPSWKSTPRPYPSSLP